MRLTRRFRIRASHSLEAPDHRKDEIGDLCGILHGHEYLVEICLESEKIDPTTGLSPLRDSLETIGHEVLRHLQNSHLNDHLEFTSGEYLCKSIFQSCEDLNIQGHLVKVAVQETSRNRFEINNESLSVEK